MASDIVKTLYGIRFSECLLNFRTKWLICQVRPNSPKKMGIYQLCWIFLQNIVCSFSRKKKEKMCDSLSFFSCKKTAHPFKCWSWETFPKAAKRQLWAFLGPWNRPLHCHESINICWMNEWIDKWPPSFQIMPWVKAEELSSYLEY